MAQDCPDDRPPGNIGAGPNGTCAADTDCTEGDNGRCVQALGQPTFCSYDQCAKDDDCGAASLCECRNPAQYNANGCFHGNCRLDADCGSGGYCSPSAVTLSPNCTDGIPIGSVGYFCHTPDDECIDADDCATSGSSGGCFFNVDEVRFTCLKVVCFK